MKTPDKPKRADVGRDKFNIPAIIAYFKGEPVRTAFPTPSSRHNKLERHNANSAWDDYGGGHEKVIRVLENAVRNFLISTEDKAARQHHSITRRLGSICERKLGQVLAYEAVEIAESNVLGNATVSASMPDLLNELQDYCGDDITGWEPLRQITQSMGISLVCKAIEEGVIGDRVVLDVLRSFQDNISTINGKAFEMEVAWQIRWCFGQTDVFDTIILNGDASTWDDPAYLTTSAPDLLEPDGLTYRLMKTTIERHQSLLPTKYLRDRVGTVFKAVSAIFKGSVDASLAAEFLECTMIWLLDCSCTGPIKDDRDRTVCTCDCLGLICEAHGARPALRSLCSYIALRYLDTQQSACQGMFHVMHFVATHIQRRFKETAAVDSTMLRRYLHFMTNFSLLQVATSVELRFSVHSAIAHILHCIDNPSLYKVKTEFALDTITFCFFSEELAQSQSRKITERFMEKGWEAKGLLGDFYNEIALEIAMRFAERSGTPEDLEWATSMQDHLFNRKSESRLKVGNSALVREHRQFRWEESINEWVEKTPLPRRNLLNRAMDSPFPASSPQSLSTNDRSNHVKQEKVVTRIATDPGFLLMPEGPNVCQQKMDGYDIDVADESEDELATVSPQLKRRTGPSMYAGHLEHRTERLKPKEPYYLQQRPSDLAGTGYSSEDELRS